MASKESAGSGDGGGGSWETRLAYLAFDGEGQLLRRQTLAAGAVDYGALARDTGKVSLEGPWCILT